MKKKHITQFIALSLVMTTFLSACGNNAGTENSKETENKSSQASEEKSSESSQESESVESEYPEYLNVDSYAPIIKDEYAGEITLTMAIVQDTGWSEFEDTWFYQYLTQEHNLNLEIISIPSAALGEQKQLMFASDEVPDMMINMWIGGNELIKYGVEDGMLLAQDEYISETLTPGIYNYLYANENYEAARLACTTPDGHIYTLPYLVEANNPSAHYAMWLNKQWLTDLGLEVPETLDEFTAALYAIKEADPAGVGRENVYPFGGGIKEIGYSNTMYLLNAFGYITGNDAYGVNPATRNGEVVIPAYDTEVFGEYLKLMNQYYNDGIINSNFFTIEQGEIGPQVAGGQNLTARVLPNTFGGDDTGWACANPLTSQWHENKETPRGNLASTGNLVISAETEYPELCMRIYDLFFNNIDGDPFMVRMGTAEEGDEYGFKQCVYVDEIDWCEHQDVPEGVNYLYNGILGFFPHLGATLIWDSQERHMNLHGKEFVNELDEQGLSRKEAILPYLVDGFPYTYYVDSETSQRITDLTTVINPYMKEQIALFVTGKRPLSELEDYKAELEAMEVEELLDIYKEIYAASQGN